MAIENEGINENELLGRDYRWQYLQNIGVRRISGSDLAVDGLQPKWLYFIDDIESLAVVVLDEEEPYWSGAFGQPVAGSLAVRGNLIPFEEQKFYCTEDNTTYIYRGGSWTGTADGTTNIRSPEYVILSGSDNIAVGRKYVVMANATIGLPATASNGHVIEIEAVEDKSVVLSGTIYFDEQELSALELTGSAIYRCIWYDGLWYVFTSLLPSAELNAAVQLAVDSANSAAVSAETTTSNMQIAVAAAESAQQSAEVAAAPLVYKGEWDASTGTLPDVPSDASSIWLIAVSGTLPDVMPNGDMVVGNILVYNIDSGVWTRIPTNIGVSAVNGQKGDVTITPELIDAIPASDSVGPTDNPVMRVGAYGGPTGSQTFFHTGNFTPSNYVAFEQAGELGWEVFKATTAEELQGLFELGDAAFSNIGTGADELVITEQLNTRLGTSGNLSAAARRAVTGDGALMAVGYKGLGSRALDESWNTAPVGNEFRTSSTGAPLVGKSFSGVTIKGFDSKGLQLVGNDSRFFARTFTQSASFNAAVWYEFNVLYGTKTTLSVDPLGGNADNYREHGVFNVSANVQNLPVPAAGSLEVDAVDAEASGGARLVQKFIPFSDTDVEFYVRSMYNGSFSDWRQYINNFTLGTASQEDVTEFVAGSWDATDAESFLSYMGIGSTDISHWNAAYGWGDHASAGYAKSSNLGTVVIRDVGNGSGDVPTWTTNGLAGYGYGAVTQRAPSVFDTWANNANRFERSNNDSPSVLPYAAGISTGGGRLQIAGRYGRFFVRDREESGWYEGWTSNNLKKGTEAGDVPVYGSSGGISNLGYGGHAIPFINNADVISKTGFYSTSSSTSGLTDDINDGILLHFAKYSSQQVQMALGTSVDIMKRRSRYSGTEGAWRGWVTMWDSVSLPQSSINNWNTAYGWGNHANAGYALSNDLGTAATKNVTSFVSNLFTAANTENFRVKAGFGTASTRAVGTSNDNIPVYSSAGLSGLGYGATAASTADDWNDNVNRFERSDVNSPAGLQYAAGISTGGGRLQIAGRYGHFAVRDVNDGTWYRGWSEKNLTNPVQTNDDVTFGDVTADNYYPSASDRRLKDKVRPITITKKQRDSLQSWLFRWKHHEAVPESKRGKLEIGLIAQEVLAIFPPQQFPGLVVKKDDGYYTIDPDKILMLTVFAKVEPRIVTWSKAAVKWVKELM